MNPTQVDASPGQLEIVCPPKTALERVCRRRRIQLLVLFGSRANGRATPRSDTDIAVLPLPGNKPDLDELYCDLSPIIRPGEVHVVNLRTAPALLMRNVALEGVPLYVTDESVWTSFRIRAIKAYEDVRRFDKYRMRAIDRYLREQPVP